MGIAEVSGGRILIEDARGTIWNGDARVALAAGGGGTDRSALPGRLGWRLRPAGLGFDLGLRAECCVRSPWEMNWRLAWGNWTLRIGDQDSVWPAQLLSGLGTPWNTLQAQGNLNVHTRGARIQWTEGRLILEGRAELLASDMSSRLSTLRPMGTYRLRVEGGTPPRLDVQTVEGSLRVSGQGEWVGARLRFQGIAEAAPEHLPVLSNLLNIIGRRDGPRAIISLG